MMYTGSNCDRKSQLSEILTEPLNPRDISSPFPAFSFLQKANKSFGLYYLGFLSDFLSCRTDLWSSFGNQTWGEKCLPPPHSYFPAFFSKTFPSELNSRVQNWVSRPKVTDFRYPISSHVPNAKFLKKMSENCANNYILQKSQREISKNEVKNIRL